MDRIDPGIAHEQEAIAEFDKIKESFVQSSPTEEAELSSAAQDAPAAGRGLDDAYSEETLNAEAAAAAVHGNSVFTIADSVDQFVGTGTAVHLNSIVAGAARKRVFAFDNS